MVRPDPGTWVSWLVRRLATGPHSYQLQLRSLRLAGAAVRLGEVFTNLREKLRVVFAVFIGRAGQMRGEFQLLNRLGVLAPLQVDKP